MKKNIQIRETCFAISSPYQLLGAIDIVTAMNLDAELFIFGTFPNYDIVADNLEKYKIFTTIYKVDLDKFGPYNMRTYIKKFVFANRIVGTFLPPNISYKYYYSSSRSSLKSALFKVLYERNPKIKSVKFDDGMATYSESGYIFMANKQRAFAERVLGWNIDDPRCTSFMVYLPQLLNLPDKYKDCKVEKLTPLKLTQKNRDMLQNIFSVGNECKIVDKYIIFDALRRGTRFFSEEEMSVLDSCYDFIAESVGKDKIICKPHPKSKIKSNCAIEEYPYSGIPMEVLYAGMEDLDNRVLISYTSSAVFTPKILFDKEPKVICLHRFLKDTRSSTLFEEIFDKFRATYSDPQRVVAPNNLDELKGVIEKL